MKIIILFCFILLLFFGCVKVENEDKIIQSAKNYFEESYSDSDEFGEPTLTNEGLGKFRVDFSREGRWIGCKISKVSIYLDNKANVIDSSEQTLCPDI